MRGSSAPSTSSSDEEIPSADGLPLPARNRGYARPGVMGSDLLSVCMCVSDRGQAYRSIPKRRAYIYIYVYMYIHTYIHIYNWGLISRVQGSKSANPPAGCQRKKLHFCCVLFWERFPKASEGFRGEVRGPFWRLLGTLFVVSEKLFVQ